jgi:xanthine dehydrogenase YagR molybdenum-binding subunit
MSMIDSPQPRSAPDRAAPRFEGRAKVTGEARYPSDVRLARAAYGYLRTSEVALGTIRSFDLTAARALPGVLDILTHETVGDQVKQSPAIFQGGYASESFRPLGSASIVYHGQPIALVIAETFEAARNAAHLIKVDYDAKSSAAAGLATPTAAVQQLKPMSIDVGDFEAAYAAAPIKVDARYSTPAQHQNPMELFATQCMWEGDRLIVHEASQYVNNLKFGLAAQLGIAPDKIQVISTYVGGAFGSKGFVTPRTALVAIAARRLGRPVKLVATRQQGFTISGYRAEARQHVQLAAGPDGRLAALKQEGWELTSRADTVAMGTVSMTTRLYACRNIVGRVNAVSTDRATPGFMRAPGEMQYGFALESALDELAEKLDMDPIELRRVNDTQTEPVKGLPYTSRSLMRCFDEGAAAFGWKDRTRPTASMRDGDWLVGWGCASAFYPTQVGSASARVRLTADGHVHISSAGHELGQGMYTMMAQVAAEQLGVPIAQVSVSLGDSNLPPANVAGGSAGTASVASAIMAACGAIRRRLGITGVSPAGVMAAIEASGMGVIEELAETRAHGQTPESIRDLYRGKALATGGVDLPDRVQMAFGAQFVEVRIHALTHEIRVARAVGAFAAGKIINARTAHGQLIGGMIWGISSALHEHSEIDPRSAGYINANLADYLLPVNADVADIQAIMVPEEDSLVNPAGVKGVGEIGVVGVAAAISNAVHHATGRRLRDLPIRIEHVM